MNSFIVILNILLFLESTVYAGGIGFLAESEVSLPNVREVLNAPVGFFGLQIESGGSSRSGASQDFDLNGGGRVETSFSSRSSSSLNDGDQIKVNAENAGKNFATAIKDGIGGIVSAIGNSFAGKSKGNSGVEISYRAASNRNNARNRGNANTNVDLNFNGRNDASRVSNVGAYSNSNYRTDTSADTNFELNLPTRINTNFNSNFRTEPRGNVEVNINNRNNPSRVSVISNSNSNYQRNPARTNTNVEVSFNNRNNIPRVSTNYNNNFRADSNANTNVDINFNNRNNPSGVSIQAKPVRTNTNVGVAVNIPARVSTNVNTNYGSNTEVNFNNRNNPSRISPSTSYNFQSKPARTNANVEVNIPARASTSFNSNFRTEPKVNVEVNLSNRNDRTRVSSNTNTNYIKSTYPTRGNSNVEVNLNNRINPSRVSANSNNNVRVNPTRGNSKTSFEISFTSRKNAPRVNTNSNSNFKAKSVTIGSGTGFELNLGGRQQGNVNIQTASQKQPPVKNVEVNFSNRNDAERLTASTLSKQEPSRKVEDFQENSRELALNSFGQISWSDENQGYSKSTIDVLKARNNYDETQSREDSRLGLGSNHRSQIVTSSSTTTKNAPIRTSGRLSLNVGGGNRFSGASSGTGKISTEFKSTEEKRTNRKSNDGDIGVRFRARGGLENSGEFNGNLDRRSNGRVSLALRNEGRDTENVRRQSDLGFSDASRFSAGARFSSGRSETTGAGNENLGLRLKDNGDNEHQVISASSSISKSKFSTSSDPSRLSTNGRDNVKKSGSTERRVITTGRKFNTATKSDFNPSFSSSRRVNIRAGSSSSRDTGKHTSNSGKIRNTGGGYGNLDISTETDDNLGIFGAGSLISTGGGKFVDEKDSRELRGDIFVGTSTSGKAKLSSHLQDEDLDLNSRSRSKLNSKFSSESIDISRGGRGRFREDDKDSREFRGDIFVGNSDRTKDTGSRGNIGLSIGSKSSFQSETIGRDRLRASDIDELRARNSGNGKFTTEAKSIGKIEEFFSGIKSKPVTENSRVEFDSRQSSSFRTTGNAEDSTEVRAKHSRFAADLNLGSRGNFGGSAGSNFRSEFRTDSNQPLKAETSSRDRGHSRNSETSFVSQSSLSRTSSTGNANSRFRSIGDENSAEDNEEVPFGVPLEISTGGAPKARFSYRR